MEYLAAASGTTSGIDDEPLRIGLNEMSKSPEEAKANALKRRRSHRTQVVDLLKKKDINRGQMSTPAHQSKKFLYLRGRHNNNLREVYPGKNAGAVIRPNEPARVSDWCSGDTYTSPFHVLHFAKELRLAGGPFIDANSLS